MTAVVVREVEQREHEQVGELIARAYATVEGPDHLADGYEAEIRDVAGRLDSTVVLVALDAGGEVRGTVTYVADPASAWAGNLRLDDGEAGFRLLAVDPDVQGRGYARALVDEVVRRARAEGRDTILLHTTPWMVRAARLYERMGFERLPERDVEVGDFPLIAYRLAPAP